MLHRLLSIALLLAASAILGGRTGAVPSSGVVLADAGGYIVAANVDGTGFRVLTQPPPGRWDTNPVASPDGSLIAFRRSGGSGSEFSVIEVMQSDGSGLRKIGAGIDARWSPDGTLLAYSTGSTISIVRPDGSGRGVLVSSAKGSPFDWSPDSRSIVYSTARGVAVVDVETGAARLVYANDQTVGPAWSPDGTRIAVVAWIETHKPGNANRLVVMNADGSAAHPIGPIPQDEPPAWSPDGTRLAFGKSTYPRPGPVVIVDASSGRMLATIPPLAGGESAAPSWSPDGDRLAFMRSAEAGGFADIGGDVWVANADGSGPVQVTRTFPFGGSQSAPYWVAGLASISPDPPVPAASLHAASSRPLGRMYYLSAADGPAVAIVGDTNDWHANPHGPLLGVWHGRGAVSWLRAGCVNRAALAGARVYWSCYASDHEGSVTGLWTATSPGGRPVRLVYHEGKPDDPALTVAGDSSLVVYSFKGSLFRLRGTTGRLIRHEDREVTPLSVDHGRVLLAAGRGLEVVGADGRLLASVQAGANDVWDVLSGDRVISLGNSAVRVYSVPGGALRATWPVGVPGIAYRAGFASGPLFPYRAGTEATEALYRVLDVATGHDAAITVGDGVSPMSAAITSTGLFYTATPLYAGTNGEIGFVPLAALRAALR